MAFGVLAIAGCGTREPTLPPGVGALPSPLVGLPTTTAELDGRELQLVVADTPGAQARGLMGIDDLGTFDGMLFAYDEPVESPFWMKDVPRALDIAFVGADGRVLAVLTMPRCDADPCPTYRSPAPFRWAVETFEGGLREVAVGDVFELP